MISDKKYEVETLHEGKWLIMKAIHFTVGEKKCLWEMVERAQSYKPSFGGVNVIPII